MGVVTPSELPPVRAAATVAATKEHEQAEALNYALRQAGWDRRLNHDADYRESVLLGAVDAVTDQRLAPWYFAHIAGLEDPEQATEYAGLDGEAWRDQLREWYRAAFERGLVETPPEEAAPTEIGQAAARTVESRFGVSLAEFVAHVVTFDRAEVMEQVMAGPTDAHTAVIRDLGDQIRRLNERIAELEED